jgi:chromosome segregation ATPase
MRLTGEQIKDIRGGGDYRLGELLDTIEAQQEELDSLQKCYDTTNKSWKEQRQEIEQLRAQAAKMREALAKAREVIKLLPKSLTNTVKACSICKINKECCIPCLFDIALEAIEMAGGGEK